VPNVPTLCKKVLAPITHPVPAMFPAPSANSLMDFIKVFLTQTQNICFMLFTDVDFSSPTHRLKTTVFAHRVKKRLFTSINIQYGFV
jgi:hypothetical protein